MMCREGYRRVTISLFFLLDIPSVFKCWVQLERIDILEIMPLKQWNWEKLTCPIDKCWGPCFKKNSIPLEVFFFSGIERESFLWLYILSPREKCWPVMSLGFYMRVFKIDLIDDQILRLKIFFLLKSFLLLRWQRKCWKKNVKTAVVYKLDDGMGGYFVNLGGRMLSISWELRRNGKAMFAIENYIHR